MCGLNVIAAAQHQLTAGVIDYAVGMLVLLAMVSEFGIVA